MFTFNRFHTFLTLSNKSLYMIYFLYITATLLKSTILMQKPFIDGYLYDASFTMLLIDIPMLLFIILHYNKFFNEYFIFIINILFLFININLLWLIFSKYF